MKKNNIHNVTGSQLKLINLKRIVFVSILTLLVVACKKNPPIEPEPTEPVMPPLTHEGRNTFGCYIDGELFVANEGESVWSIPPVSGSFDEETKRLMLQGTKHIQDSQSDLVVFAVIVDNEEGPYTFDVNTEHFKGYTKNSGTNSYYYHNIDNKGGCFITHLDEVNNIISGTFSMILINLDYPERPSLKLEEGRFDFHY